jgi:hypothetical protein
MCEEREVQQQNPVWSLLFRSLMESHFISELRWNSVILPMVLQIRETMVLQGVELAGKASSSHIHFLLVPQVRKKYVLVSCSNTTSSPLFMW